jgi:phage gp36-like protein
MPYYTNEASLKAAFGDNEVSGLLNDSPGVESQVRLEKAAAQAYDEINTMLYSANYTVPLLFTEFGAVLTPPDVEIPLMPVIQAISDCFTAFYLAASTDLNKKKYEDCRAEGLNWLNRVIEGELVLNLTRVDPLAGPGNLVTIARPQVFNRHQLSERAIFGTGWRGD